MWKWMAILPQNLEVLKDHPRHEGSRHWLRLYQPSGGPRSDLCGFNGIIGDTCPHCGRSENEVEFEANPPHYGMSFGFILSKSL